MLTNEYRLSYCCGIRFHSVLLNANYPLVLRFTLQYLPKENRKAKLEDHL